MARTATRRSGPILEAAPPALDDPWNLLPVAAVRLSANGGISRANLACQDLLGYDTGDMVGLRMDDLLVDSVDFRFLEKRISLLGRVAALEACVRRKDGSTRHVVIDASPDPLVPGGIHCAMSDHSVHKRTEGHAREQVEFLLRNEEAIIIQNLEGRVIYWSMGAERLYGLPSFEVLGQPLPRELGGDSELLEQARNCTLERGEWRGGFQCLTPAGTRFEVESRWVLLRDQSGTPQSILLINEDAAESRLLEEERLRAQRQECIGTLAGGIAHDLNNILQPITIALDLFRGRLADGESQELLGMVDSNLRRATELVRQILTFTSGVRVEREPVDVSHLFQGVSNFIRQAFPKTIRFEVSTPQNLPPVLADHTQMEQVLLNLCVNARDAMLEGGILRIDAMDFPVDDRFAAAQPLAKPGRYVRISVSDTGRGIPMQIRKKIFEPFFTTKGPGKGTGLGLATALGIIRSHSGFLTLETEEGRGSSFHVFIPAAPPRGESPKTPAAAQPDSATPGHGESILLVDDESTVLKVMKRSLEKAGYRVLTASDGLEGLEAFRRNAESLRLVLTDMAMPGMDGLQLVTEIRKDGSSVPVLFSSGLDASANPEALAELGIRKVLPKPCSSQTILRAIREALHDEPTP